MYGQGRETHHRYGTHPRVSPAGAATLVARRDQVVHLGAAGLIDREQNRTMPTDAVFRVHSMTKRVICVALMTLYEQRRSQLIDPVSRSIPAFGELKVLRGREGSASKVGV